MFWIIQKGEGFSLLSTLPLNIQTRIMANFLASVSESRTHARTILQTYTEVTVLQQNNFRMPLHAKDLKDSPSPWYSADGAPSFQKKSPCFVLWGFCWSRQSSKLLSQLWTRWDQVTGKFIAYDLHNIYTHQTIKWPLRPYRWGLCHSVIDLQWPLALRGQNLTANTEA